MLTEKCDRLLQSRRRGVDIRSAFDMYDLSKTGFVSRRDFREAMRKLQVISSEKNREWEVGVIVSSVKKGESDEGRRETVL